MNINASESSGRVNKTGMSTIWPVTQADGRCRAAARRANNFAWLIRQFGGSETFKRLAHTRSLTRHKCRVAVHPQLRHAGGDRTIADFFARAIGHQALTRDLIGLPRSSSKKKFIYCDVAFAGSLCRQPYR